VRTSHYLGGFTALLENDLDQKMYVDTRDISVTPHLLCRGKWEHWITNVFGNYTKGAVVFDVGANLGWYSCVASFCEAKKVFAFEPSKRLAELLHMTRSVNGFNWEISESALADTSGPREMYMDRNMFGGSTLIPRDVADRVHVVPCESFDDIMDHSELKRLSNSFVFKIDVEGYEPRVVMGASDFIEKENCTLFVEHHADPNCENRNAEMWDFLQRSGYSASHVTRESVLQPIEYSAIPGVPEADMLFFQRFAR
jgi:FkbM family methyltransferase